MTIGNLRKPRILKIVAVIALGAAAFALYEAGTHEGPSSDSVGFSPDGKYLAYLFFRYEKRWGVSKVIPYPVSIAVRWRAVGSKARDQELLIFPELTQTSSGFRLDRRDFKILFSLDSARLAVLTPEGIMIVHLSTGTAEEIRINGEGLIGGTWSSKDALIYATYDEGRTALWRQPIPARGEKPVKMYEEMGPDAYPYGLRNHEWSPCGRYTLITSNKDPERRTALLDITSRRITPLLASVDQCVWAPDGSTLMVNGTARGRGARVCQVLAVETATGAVTDLTQKCAEAFPGSTDLTFVEPLLTVDSKYLILDTPRGLLVQLNPWKVALSTEGSFRWSPVPGWLVLRKGNTCAWTDYEGRLRIPLGDWPDEWTWSPGGQKAAFVKDNRVEVIEPSLPHKD